MKFYCTIDADAVRPYMPDVPVMLPASSWARYGLKAPKIPAHVTERAADCGGFVATKVWGDYKYTPERYVAWLETFGPRWAATMDYCCEDEITSGKPGIVRERQQRTTEMAQHFWQQFRDAPWTWVPTVQGWHLADYHAHVRQLRPLIEEMHAHYGKGSAFRVGIGTLCRRASVRMIHEVVAAVSQEIPDTPLHLWGIKLGALQARDAMPLQVTSVDSAAWNSLFGRGKEVWKASGLPQRRWIYQVAMPTYLAKVEKALTTPKQLSLFGGIAA